MIKSIQDEGFPQYRNPFNKGLLLIQFAVTFPSCGWCNDASKLKQLEDLLPPREKEEVEKNFEVVDLEELVFFIKNKNI